MDFFVDLIKDFSGFLEKHNDFLALSLAVTILVLFGSKLNEFFKQKLGRLNAFLRSMLFVGICLLYGVLVKLLADMIEALFDQLNDVTLAPVVVLLLVTFGILLEKRS